MTRRLVLNLMFAAQGPGNINIISMSAKVISVPLFSYSLDVSIALPWYHWATRGLTPEIITIMPFPVRHQFDGAMTLGLNQPDELCC